MARVLVVDDEPGVRESLRMLVRASASVDLAEGVEPALECIARNRPDLILLDLVMPGRSGLDLLAELEKRGAHIPVVVLSATKTVATAVEAMKLGAIDYITKPFELEALRLKVEQQLSHRALAEELERLRDEVAERNRLGDLVGASPAMREVFRNIDRIAASEATVLVAGESGTGKELVARAIHPFSPRKEARARTPSSSGSTAEPSRAS